MDFQECRVLVAPNTRPDLFFATGKELLERMSGYLNKERLPYRKDFESGLFNEAIMNANKAFVSNYKRYLTTSNCSGETKHMSRKKGKLSFKTSGKVKIFYDYITLPKFGKIKLFEKGYIPQGKKYSKFTFTFDGLDWWFSVEVTDTSSEPVKENNGEDISFDFDKKGNLYINGQKKYENVIYSKNYQRQADRYRKLSKKLKRQSVESLHWSKKHPVKVSKTTRNILKTKKTMSKVANRLNNIKKDFFRKVAKELAILKPNKVFTLSNVVIRTMKNNFLTRFLRESSTKEFFNILINKFKNTGAEVIRCLPYNFAIA